MARITCGSCACAATTKKMIESTQTTQAANPFIRKGEIMGTERSAILTWLRLVTLIDAATCMMIGVVNDVTIVGIIIAVGLEAVEVPGGTALRGYPTCRLRRN
jgi:hypothetical protein